MHDSQTNKPIDNVKIAAIVAAATSDSAFPDTRLLESIKYPRLLSFGLAPVSLHRDLTFRGLQIFLGIYVNLHIHLVSHGSLSSPHLVKVRIILRRVDNQAIIKCMFTCGTGKDKATSDCNTLFPWWT
ncbi:unnamed protein product [Protopolystoma xenopodis]|uniref:Uncharacterized protein n=1 Tax=Protopolystoma xenopodis TaxID=117903 RepID=A0A448XS46_9PLAT|nr:unnamed protein product [Protopolystoma xenopodis]